MIILAQILKITKSKKNIMLFFCLQSSSDAAYLARHAGLGAGCPEEATSLTVNRLCGSGFQAAVSAAQVIAIHLYRNI